MPGGVSTIHCSRAGKKVRATVLCDSATADVCRAELARHRASGPHRPYFDFDHQDLAASAWPVDFVWRETPEPGVYAVVEWSEAGAAAVRGKTHQGFSPCLYDEVVPDGRPARVLGLPLNMGGLVNNPAFRRNRRLFAKNTQERTMKPKLIALVAALAAAFTERTALAAKAADGSATNLDALKAKDAEIHQAIDQARQLLAEAEGEDGDGAELAELKAKVTTLETDLAQRAAQAAETAVQAAVSRGAIAAADATTQKAWKDSILRDPANAALLAKMHGAPAVQQGRMTSSQGKPEVQVLQIDCNDALRGYLEAKSPRERGEVYRTELHGRLDKGERIPFERFSLQAKATAHGAPLSAENTLGTLVGNIISQRTLSLIASKRPMLQGILNDFSDEQARLNQAIYVRKIGFPTVQNFGAAASDTSDTDVSLTLSAHKQVLFSYTAAEYLATARNLVAEHSQALAVALGNHLVDAVAALITDAFTAEATGAASTKDYTSLTGVVKALNSAGVPDFRRFGWVNSDVAEALRNDDLMAMAFDRARSNAYAAWANVEGFENIWEFPALPANGVNLIAFFGMADALALATRVVLNPEAILGVGYPGKIQTVMDPVTGFAVVSNQWIGQSDLAVNDRLILAYGVARGNVTCGYKWVTS